MAVAMCAPPPLLPSFAVVAASAANDSDRFYKFGTPSPPSVPEYSPPSCYSELEESGFHSDEEMQKVRDVCECLVNVWGGPLSVFTGRRYLTVYTFARAVRLWRSRPAWENAPLNCREFPNSLYLSPLSFRPATR